MAEKTIRVDKDTWQRVKVCAAEADLSLKVFVDNALIAACAEHDRLKRAVRTSTPVRFLEEAKSGR